MSRIKILSDNLSNQIAAGEVVERPSSVVKELIENSLDANAQRIKIQIELGGRRLIRVTDDGEGMVRDDAILAFERHATSKIGTLEDLAKIETLGFRGEAMASIASVAKVELITKPFDEAATRVRIEGGKLIDVKEAARPNGTTITVTDLFFNTPARRKFMRSQATENYHIINTVTHYALANPKAAFTLTNNGRETIRVSPAKDLRERAYQLFGGNMIESLLPVTGGREFIASIEGFVSAPRERRTTRDSQYFFINGRFVRDKIIAGGLLEGFRSVLPHGVYPVAFLFLRVPFEEIDVNVHPAKTEVRFRRGQAVKDVIAGAIRESLKNAGIVNEREARRTTGTYPNGATAGSVETEDTGRGENAASPGFAEIHDDLSHTASEKAPVEDQSRIDFEIPAVSDDFEDQAAARISPKVEDFGDARSLRDSENTEKITLDAFAGRQVADYSILPPVDSGAAIPKAVEVADISAGKIKAIGQLHESFIIAVDDEGMLLIDQHVAHERILFDKFRKQETERKIESQNLLLPETIDLIPAQVTAFEEVRSELEEYGFGMMKLSGRTIAIQSVPTDLPASEIRNLFSEILDTVGKDKKGGVKATIRDEIAASMACKAAVKINTKLTPEKMNWLIDRLLISDSPTTCPHGRPVILRLTIQDIERKFHRT
ncbi:MAG: DNA mismatch repair endonuclease MutL [Pyrinomonadaceae bacterium]